MKGLNKKAQGLIIILWILAILSVLAVGIAHRTSMALKLADYQLDRLRALYLAKAAVSRAIAEIEKDGRERDGLDDLWSDNRELFEKVSFTNDGYAEVSYALGDGADSEPVFGVIDEESKININKASLGLLEALLAAKGAEKPADTAKNILAWRSAQGGAPEEEKKGSEGYPDKKSDFVNREELLLVKGVDEETFAVMRDSVTVWGAGKVNINTCSEGVLDVLVDYCKEQIPGGDSHPEDLVSRIMDARPASTFTELEAKLKEQRTVSSAQMNILAELEQVADFKSSCFFISARAKMEGSRWLGSVSCVYDRAKKRMVFWHES